MAARGVVEMTPERWQRVKSLFARALDNATDGRISLIAGSGETPSIIAEARKLLSRDARATSFLVNTKTARPSDVSPVLMGDVVGGQFQITSELGRGGMGIVYRAEDLILSRPVALKFLSDGQEASSSKDRVLGEARAAAGLNHPNICVIHETGEHHGQPYIVMELLEGMTLKQRIGPEGLPLRQLLDWGAQIAEGLDAAHRAGVIHRDIKPANIFITAQERVKILDFGLARLGAPQVSGSHAPAQFDLSSPGLAAGTVPYMAPEQARGEALDSRADLFSLGTVLYEMATGKRVCTGATTADALEAVLHRTPEAARHIQASIPEELDRIIFRALEKQRESRYQDAGEMLEDLRRLQRETNKQAAPLRRWRLAVALILAGVVAALAAALNWKYKPPGTLTERQLTRNAPENHFLGAGLSPDGKELVYFDMKGLHIRSIDTGAVRDIDLPGEMKSSVWDAEFLPDGKEVLFDRYSIPGGHHIWVIPATGGVPRQLSGNVRAYATSPSGIVFTSAAGSEIWVMGLNGENATKILSTETGELGKFAAVAWSPGGERIALIRSEMRGRNQWRSPWGGSIETVGRAGGDRRIVFSDSRLDVATGPRRALEWSGDGRIIFVLKENGPRDSDEDGNLWAIRTNSKNGNALGKPERITNWFGIAPREPSVSRDGRRLAVIKFHGRKNIYVGEIQDQGRRLDSTHPFTDSDSLDIGCSWTPDGKAILYGSDVTGQMQLFEKQVGQDTVQAITTLSDPIRGCALTPDGNWILYSTEKSSGGSRFQSVQRLPRSGGRAEQLFQFPADGNSYWACSPGSGGACIYGRLEKGNIVFYLLDPLHGLGKELARMPGPAGGQLEFSNFQVGFAVAPEGTRVALPMYSRLAVLDLRTRTERRIRLPRGWANFEVAFTRDGKALNASVIWENSYQLVRIQLDGKVDVLLDQGRDFFMSSPLPSPNGRYIAFSQQASEGNAWLLENF